MDDLKPEKYHSFTHNLPLFNWLSLLPTLHSITSHKKDALLVCRGPKTDIEFRPVRPLTTNFNYTSCHGTLRRAGLILIHRCLRFPLSLILFHNHRSLPVSIRGYHLSLLYHGFLTLPFLPPFSILPRPTILPPLSLLLVYMPIINANTAAL